MRKLKLFREFIESEKIFLIIDNSMPPEKKYLSKVVKWFEKSGLNFKIVSSIEELNQTKPESVLGAVSTGSDYRTNDIETNRLSFAAIESLDCPILGLCYGFQSMAKYYGSEIGSEDEVCKKVIVDYWDKSNPLFSKIDLDKQSVSVCFHDFPTETPNGFKSICMIDGKIAGISNGSNRFGLLFHPEEQTETYIVLENFTNLCESKIKV